MRIAIITSECKPETTGVGQTVYDRAVSFSELGHDVLVLCPDYEKLAHLYPNYRQYLGQINPHLTIASYAAEPLKLKPDILRPLPFWRYDFSEPLAAFKPDILHVDEPFRLYGLQLSDGHLRRPGIAYSREAGIPTTAMWRTDYFKYAPLYLSKQEQRILLPILTELFRWVYRSYDYIICHSSFTECKLRSMGLNNILRGYYHGIDTSHFDVNERSDDQSTLTYVGRIDIEKNLTVLFDSFFKLQKTHPEVKLHLVGDGLLRETYEEKYRHPNIIFHGRIPFDDISKIYASTTVFVSPSSTETFGNTVVEAAAAGVPVVAARSGGYLDSVSDDYNGYLFEPNDSDDLVHKIRRLFDQPLERKRLGENGRLWAECFDIHHVTESLAEQYRELIRCHKPRTHHGSQLRSMFGTNLSSLPSSGLGQNSGL